MIVKLKFIKEPERLEVFNFLNLYFSRKHLPLRNSLSSAASLQSGQSQTFFWQNYTLIIQSGTSLRVAIYGQLNYYYAIKMELKPGQGRLDA